MKKFFVLLVIMLFGVSVPAWADILVVDVDTVNPLTNINTVYWTGDDYNTEGVYNTTTSKWDDGNDQLKNANEITEAYWLAALLGLPAPTASLLSYDRDDFFVGFLNGYNPGFKWTYAVVKWNGYWTAYQDDGDFLLTVPTQGVYKKDISHVTFFGVTQVPEPATLLFLGAGLAGLAGFRLRTSGR